MRSFSSHRWCIARWNPGSRLTRGTWPRTGVSPTAPSIGCAPRSRSIWPPSVRVTRRALLQPRLRFHRIGRLRRELVRVLRELLLDFLDGAVELRIAARDLGGGVV